jgi:hypothetical protein
MAAVTIQRGTGTRRKKGKGLAFGGRTPTVTGGVQEGWPKRFGIRKMPTPRIRRSWKPS